ncbi:metabolite traffic protein EboE [Amycolatopsis sp. FDAARGOS 1241]|uniref:metabolite traffic protein EboE n=1 Tax=Amycolatopsis sp. FDAARGOS 1241 TaxID=2778070 RepID=UPI00194E9100|nr:metabolite traffic protein EboE [Amycolatopsis sp. FDAARGOS 1241]QRP49388.1 metabolite traffic protein EboE [Amycolatopsis sp. FDAARGOS 1241]
MDLGTRLGHLSYSTLVHPGDTWDEMNTSLETYVPEVKRRVSPGAPFGVSLRLSGASAGRLADDGPERERLKKYLAENDLYVYTVNAFPHGPFKGRSVMENVYEPDWSTEERVAYTVRVADVLADIAADGVEPTIQTVPLAYRPKVTSEAYVELFTRNVLRVVAHLVGLERRTGRRVKLAIEPEPFCYLETIEETVRYFTTRLYSRAAAQALSGLADLPLAEAFGALRRHVGIVFDIGHQAVEFDDIPASLDLLADAGVPIFKLQQAAALWVPEVTHEVVRELERFTRTIYLSQTSELRDGSVTRHLKLSDAIAAWRREPGGTREWRTHFHVPVFLDDLGPFRTTRFALEQALDRHRAQPQSAHLEIETYTWDVLPEHLKTGDITDYVVRELEFVRDRLTA